MTHSHHNCYALYHEICLQSEVITLFTFITRAPFSCTISLAIFLAQKSRTVHLSSGVMNWFLAFSHSVFSKDTTTAQGAKESSFQFCSLNFFSGSTYYFQEKGCTRWHSRQRYWHSWRYRRTNFWFLSQSRGEAACYTMITVVTTRSLTTSKHMTAMTAASTWLTHISLELAGQKSRPLHIHHGRNTLLKPPRDTSPREPKRPTSPAPHNVKWRQKRSFSSQSLHVGPFFKWDPIWRTFLHHATQNCQTLNLAKHRPSYLTVSLYNKAAAYRQ